MADQYVQIPPQSTGLKIDTSELTVNAQTVERQRIIISDTTGAAAFAAVMNSTPAGSEYGIVVRDALKGQQVMAASRPVVLASDQSAINVAIVGQPTGGFSSQHLVSAATTNATSIKASAGAITGWTISNNNGGAAPRFVKFHNTAGVPTPGSGVVYTIMVPGNKTVFLDSTIGIKFTTGIGMTITALGADADTTAVAAGDVIVNIHWV